MSTSAVEYISSENGERIVTHERYVSPVDYANSHPEAREYIREFFWRHVGHWEKARRLQGEVPYADKWGHLDEMVASYGDNGTMIRIVGDLIHPDETEEYHIVVGDMVSGHEQFPRIVAVSGYETGRDVIRPDSVRVFYLESDLPEKGYPHYLWPRIEQNVYSGEVVYYEGNGNAEEHMHPIDELHAATIGRLRAVGSRGLTAA